MLDMTEPMARLLIPQGFNCLSDRGHALCDFLDHGAEFPLNDLFAVHYHRYTWEEISANFLSKKWAIMSVNGF